MTTKIHALCDSQGKPTALCLTGGNSHDLSGFDVLHKQITAAVLIADRGYDADRRVREVLRKANIEAVIPPRKNRKEPAEYDKEMYKKRHKIENWFSRLKDYRGIATRFDKLAQNFLSGVFLAAAFTWII